MLPHPESEAPSQAGYSEDSPQDEPGPSTPFPRSRLSAILYAQAPRCAFWEDLAPASLAAAPDQSLNRPAPAARPGLTSSAPAGVLYSSCGLNRRICPRRSSPAATSSLDVVREDVRLVSNRMNSVAHAHSRTLARLRRKVGTRRLASSASLATNRRVAGVMARPKIPRMVCKILPPYICASSHVFCHIIHLSKAFYRRPPKDAQGQQQSMQTPVLQ